MLDYSVIDVYNKQGDKDVQNPSFYLWMPLIAIGSVNISGSKELIIRDYP